MSQSPTHARKLNLVAADPLARRAGPVIAERESQGRRVQNERGARALGAQAGQWRWRSGRELWGSR